MKQFLPKATDFTDMEKKENPNWMGKDTICPVCDGYGGWNLTLNAYGPGRHFRASCSQCNGWGWVDKEDATCVHEMKELSPAQCREKKVRHWGNCYHVYECQKCGVVHSYDSSG